MFLVTKCVNFIQDKTTILGHLTTNLGMCKPF